MKLEQLTTLAAIGQFLEGTQATGLNAVTSKQERYRWVQKTLVKHRYLLLGKVGKGIITRYLMNVTDYSHSQIKRQIGQYSKIGKVVVKVARHNIFQRAYTDADICLLAGMDERHGHSNRPVLKKFCERAYLLYSQSEYQRRATISVSHLYNFRHSKTYQRQRYTLIKYAIFKKLESIILICLR